MGIRQALAELRRRLGYNDRVGDEIRRYKDVSNVHDLPPIFHYWSNKFLRPKLEQFGFSSPDAFFQSRIEGAVAQSGEKAAILSIGAGNCDVEVGIARTLVDRGLVNFRIDCIDINHEMLARGAASAAAARLGDHVTTTCADINAWRPRSAYDVVVANQSLHHIVRLEHVLDCVASSLTDRGIFIASDMIGRNGHMRWPEALAIVREFWEQLPAGYRYNQQLRRQEERFLDWDCSVSGFEGIRAQDILPLLVDRFEFDLFIPFANVIDPFIDRSFGHHFNPDSPWDRDFIDAVHARDEREIRAGHITPTHMIAVMCRGRTGEGRFLDDLAPAKCIRVPTAA